jgi:DNA-binding transcriptional MerR regulator
MATCRIGEAAARTSLSCRPRLNPIGEAAARTSLSCRPRLNPIGEAASKIGVTGDTLRYYERIGLLGAISRNGAGARLYSDADLSRLRFIRRAQQMNFSLAEIGKLLTLRAEPRRARRGVRELTARKLADIEIRLGELAALRDELHLLLNLCAGSRAGCAILKEMDRR